MAGDEQQDTDPDELGVTELVAVLTDQRAEYVVAGPGPLPATSLAM
ncbi:hypothetical protein [Nonomuraea sp. SYSU D8015]|nr:hypothetical protein [Nonomuraea sp. SYSU D8015]